MIEHFLASYGYLVLFFGVALEGETFLLTASYLASRGFFHLGTVIAAAVAANAAADQVYYALARWKGRPWLDGKFGHLPRYQRLMAQIGRHSTRLLLVSRFAFGLRIAIPAACGVVNMPPARFLVVNLAASLLWAAPTAWLGYWLGHAAEAALGQVRHYEVAAGLALLTGMLLWATYRSMRRYPELWQRPQRWILQRPAPLLVGFMGFLNVLSAIRPRSAATLHGVAEWFPLEVSQPSRPLMLLAGIALLEVSRGLGRRKQMAWLVAVVALSASLLLHITRALDLHYSLVSGALLAYLIAHRRRYVALSDPASLRQAAVMVPALALAVFAYGWAGLNELYTQFRWEGAGSVAAEVIRAGILVVGPRIAPLTPHAAHFLGSLAIAGWLARAYLLVLVLRPVILRQQGETPQVHLLVEAHGRHGLSAFAGQPDKCHLLVGGGQGFVGFATIGGVAMTCGDPVAPRDVLPAAVQEFRAHCERHGWTSCFYEVAESNLAVYRQERYQCLKMAEEAVIPLSSFSLTGSRRSNLRHTVTKAEKLGLRFSVWDPQHSDLELEEEMEAISEEWLAAKKGGEMSFTMGRFSLEELVQIPVTLCCSAGRLEAFASWRPYRQGHGLYLDLMRKRNDAPFGTMDLLLARSLLHFREQGYEIASLANAPLANTADARATLDRGVAFLFEHFNQIYGYKNLFLFKRKFDPLWEGRYLAYPSLAALPKITYAIVSLHSSGGIFQFLPAAAGALRRQKAA